MEDHELVKIHGQTVQKMYELILEQMLYNLAETCQRNDGISTMTGTEHC